MKERILEINPQAIVNAHKCFFLPETKNQFDFSQYDYIVDAVDTVTAKMELVMNPGYNQVNYDQIIHNAELLEIPITIFETEIFDDVIETIVMGMMYGAQIQTMMPKLHSTNFPGMELIRP